MPRLSKKLVDELKPRPKDYFVWDDQVKGFGVRVKPSGTRSYIVQYKTRRGKARRFTIGKHGTISTKDARKRAMQLLSEVLFGTDPMERAKEIREAYSFRELAEEFLARKKGEIILDESRRILQRDVLPFLGNILASEVTKRDVVELVDKIRDRGSKVMSNRTLSLLKRLFSFGIARDIVVKNPAHGIKQVREQSRDRTLSGKEIRTFWYRLDDIPSSDFVKQALKLILTTAQRPGEVARMEWKEIDFKTKVWNLPAEKTKNRNCHSVPLSSLAEEILKSIPRLDGPYVFPAKSGKALDGNRHMGVSALSAAVRRHKEIFGLEDWSPHDLRRSAATQMAAVGVSRIVVGNILNHRERGVTQIYDRHRYELEMRQGLEAWAMRILEITEGQRAKVIPLIK